jgi:hypothetical protein
MAGAGRAPRAWLALRAWWFPAFLIMSRNGAMRARERFS